MSQQKRAVVLLGSLALIGLAGCQANSSAVAPAPASPPAPAPSALASAAPVATAPAPAPTTASAPATSVNAGLSLGPAATGAPAAEREAAATRLLQGHDASALPERAVDPESEFDPEWDSRILWRLRPDPGVRHSPKVRVGALSVGAGLPPEIVTRIFRQNLGRIRLCYEQQLATKPKLEGKLQLDFVITLEGDVASPRASAGTFNDAPLFKCLVGSLKDVVFPQPDAGAPITVSAPITLAP